MMVRMNGEEVSIEGSTGKANETNMIGARRAVPRRADLSSSQNEEGNREEITRMEYVNSR